MQLIDYGEQIIQIFDSKYFNKCSKLIYFLRVNSEVETLIINN